MKTIFFSLLLICFGLFAKAQTGFTAKDFDNFTLLTSKQLLNELRQRSYKLQGENHLQGNEVQYRLTAGSDRNRILVVIFVNDKMTIMDYETNQFEQTKFKNSLVNDGFVYNSTTSNKGVPSVKYTKNGGLAGKGLEVELSRDINNGQQYYGVFFWNWRTGNTVAKSENSRIVSPSANNNLDGYYTTGGQNISIKNGKVAICLIGQLFINAWVKKIDDKNYQLFFLNEDKSQYTAGTDWSVYSKVQYIAKISVINSANDLKLEWSGLWNKKNYQWEYDTLDGDPQTVKILKKG
ncbi:MAG: hypothetical protein JWR38_5923 [Mucilaginibacter sp.]|nr:hypothetical protein [Mucilaginibacter sp.]